MQHAEIKKTRLSFLWIIPLIALGVGLWLAWRHLEQIGPEITITFDSAQDIVAGKTPLRYKDITVGTVERLKFTEDLKRVEVQAQMTAAAVPLLNKDSQFWVVRPQISAAGITGLNTIISGSYIAVDPGKNQAAARHFKGLQNPPPIQPSEHGLRLRLTTDNAAGINLGTPIYYRGIKVGQVTQIQYNAAGDDIFVSIFIRQPYDHFVYANTKFWNVGGIKLDVNATGAHLAVQSAETLALGGIAFNTIASLDGGRTRVHDNAVFPLYASESQTTQPPTIDKKYFVLYFSDSVRGLAPGAPVAFNGIKVGNVIEVRLLYDEKRNKAVIPVLISVDPSRISIVNRKVGTHDIFANLVANGLQASMETESLITGAKFIKLAVYPGGPRQFLPDRYSPYPVMPSRSTGIARITDGVSEIIDRIRKIPFERFGTQAGQIVSSVQQAAQNLSSFLTSEKIREIGRSLTTTLDNVNKILSNTNRRISGLSAQMQQTLYGMSPASPMYYSLQQTLEALQKAANALNALTSKLKKKPNALIFGD